MTYAPLGPVVKGHAMFTRRVRAHTTIGPRTQRWQAMCSCGWQGDLRFTRIEARQDYTAHKETASR